MNNKKIQEIQGLRGLSLVLVLFFHIDKDFLPSGYLGVDAFFAISGFVITRLILKQKASETFTYSNFYLSRGARLLPSLFVTIIVTLLVFYLTFGKTSDLINLSQSAIAASLSISNIYFFGQSGYFSDSSIYKPLLHTWSLGVEEQFYLFYPLFLVFILKYKAKTMLILSLIIIGFFISVLGAYSYTEHVFYLSPFRVYQFFLGGFFSILLANNNNSLGGKYNYLLLHWAIPCLLVLLSFTVYETGRAQVLAQSVVAFLVAYACYLAALKTPNESAVQTLNQPFLVKIGEYSYSIYLVHWPVITWLYSYSDGRYDDSYFLKTIALITSIVLGVLLYKFVDQPCRFGVFKKPRFNIFQPKATIPLMLTSLLLSSVLQMQNNLPNNVAVINAKHLKELSKKRSESFPCRIFLANYFNENDRFNDLCLELAKGQTRHVLIMGDSLVNGFRLALSKNTSFNINAVSLAGCPPYFGHNKVLRERMKKRLKACRVTDKFPWSKEMLKELTSAANYDALIVSANWYARAFDLLAIEESMAVLNQIGMPVYFVGVHPFFKESIPRMLESKIAKNEGVPRYSTDLNHWRKDFEQKVYNRQISSISQQFENIKFFNIFDVLCPEKCKVIDEKHSSLYVDQSHLSVFGIDYLAKSKQIQELHKKILLGR